MQMHIHIDIQVVLFCSLCVAAGKTLLCVFIRPSHSHRQNGGAQHRALCCKKRYNWTALLHSLFFSQVTHSPTPVCLCWTAASSPVAISTGHEWPQSCFVVTGVERLLDCPPPSPPPSLLHQFACAELLPFHLLESAQVMSGLKVVLLWLVLRGYWTAPIFPLQPFCTCFPGLNCCHFTCWNQDWSWVDSFVVTAVERLLDCPHLTPQLCVQSFERNLPSAFSRAIPGCTFQSWPISNYIRMRNRLWMTSEFFLWRSELRGYWTVCWVLPVNLCAHPSAFYWETVPLLDLDSDNSTLELVFILSLSVQLCRMLYCPKKHWPDESKN